MGALQPATCIHSSTARVLLWVNLLTGKTELSMHEHKKKKLLHEATRCTYRTTESKHCGLLTVVEEQVFVRNVAIGGGADE